MIVLPLLSLALLHWSDFTYVGYFKLPEVQNQASRFAYVSGGNDSAVMAYNPNGDGGNGSLFVRGHAQMQLVSEINIPAPSKTGESTARQLQPFADVSGGRLHTKVSDGGTLDNLAGMVVLTPPGQSAPSVFWTLRQYYHVTGSDPESEGVSTLNLSNPQPKGLWNINGPYNATAGYLAEIPAAFADQYLRGARIVAGEEAVNGVATSSWGPAAFAIKPWLADGTYPPDRTNLASIPLVYHPRSNAAGSPGIYPGWNPACKVGSVQWIQSGDKQALVFTVTIGSGICWYGTAADKPAEVPDDPVVTDKGYHAYPYQQQLWFYSVEDIQKSPKAGCAPGEFAHMKRTSSIHTIKGNRACRARSPTTAPTAGCFSWTRTGPRTAGGWSPCL